jgi:hypothetical protein
MVASLAIFGKFGLKPNMAIAAAPIWALAVASAMAVRWVAAGRFPDWLAALIPVVDRRVAGTAGLLFMFFFAVFFVHRYIRQEAAAHKRCPECRQVVPLVARVCWRCQHEFTESALRNA